MEENNRTNKEKILNLIRENKMCEKMLEEIKNKIENNTNTKNMIIELINKKGESINLISWCKLLVVKRENKYKYLLPVTPLTILKENYSEFEKLEEENYFDKNMYEECFLDELQNIKPMKIDENKMLSRKFILCAGPRPIFYRDVYLCLKEENDEIKK